MLTRERKAHILGILQRDRRVVAKTVSQELSLSEDTVRRDLRANWQRTACCCASTAERCQFLPQSPI